MAFTRTYAAVEPLRADIDALTGPGVLEFGAPWCGYCIAAQPLLEAAFTQFPNLQHIKVEDGPGRPLGRSFRVKLWPTLVFLRDGAELARVVRPASVDAITEALARISDGPA
ncbi:MAG: thioredoxin family protein [Gammaproteobacteria bacterium]|nr:thioredoxin family protein [Gammaproteobacteria bacterium]